MAANEDRQRAGDQIEAAIAERLKLALLADEDQAECRRLVEALEAQAADRRGREARIVELEKKLEQSRSVLLQKEREYGRDVAMLKSTLAAAHAARASAAAVAGDARDGLIAEHQRALADVQTGKRDELEVLERRLQAAAAEHRRLQALVEEDAADRERSAADHRAAVDTLQQSLARARADAALQVEQSRQALAESRSALAQSLAEQSDNAERLEEQTRELDLIRGEHQRALADVEASKREALDELRSQLSQALLDQRRLASHADEQKLELNRLRAEHQTALTDTETRHRDALAELRRELAHTAERAAQHQHERDRISAEHALAIANLQAGNEASAAELRSKLSDAVAEHHRLTALLEEHGRERERLAAEQVQVVFKDGPALEQALEAEHERAGDADRLHEPFDDADDAFIHQLLGATHAKRVPETHTDPKTGRPQQAVSGMLTLKTDGEPADDMFDAKDATFARRLMDTPGPLPRSADGDS